jgi:hypothetical protein
VGPSISRARNSGGGGRRGGGRGCDDSWLFVEIGF